MRRQISWLVLATTSTVVVSFVIPLCLLVRNLAEDRGMLVAEQEARNVALLVASFGGDAERLNELIISVNSRGVVTTGVKMPRGRTFGSWPESADDAYAAQARAEGSAVEGIDDAGGHVVLPVLLSGDEQGEAFALVRTDVAPEVLRQGVVRAWASIIGLGLALLALAWLIAYRLGRRVSAPLLRVAGVAHQLREGDLSARAEVTGTEEIEELAGALNGLAERTRELLADERAAVGDLSHRLRTPVTALRLDAEAVSDEELASRLQQHIATLQVTIDQIVTEARRPVRSDLRATCDPIATVRERTDFWRVLAEDQGRPIHVALPEVPVLVRAAADELADVVDVLIDNVFAYTPERTPLEVAIDIRSADEGGIAAEDRRWIVLSVSDEGPGFASGAPTDRPGSTGLGLDIARRFAEGTGGRLRISSTYPGQDPPGTTIQIFLPAVR